MLSSAAARQTLKARKEQSRGAGAGARKKRPAFNLTCSNCRRRKMRCDSGQPGCLICAAYNDTCTYDKTPPVSQVVAMAKRLQQLEDVISKLRLTDNKELLATLEEIEGSSPAPSSSSPYSDKTVIQHLGKVSASPDLDPSTRNSEPAMHARKSSGDSIAMSVPVLLSELSMSADGQLKYYGSTSAVHQPVAVPRRPSSTVPTELDNNESRSLLVSNASQSRSWEDYALSNAAMHLDIPRETITRLLDTHWIWIQPMFMFTYRPAFMNDMSTGGPYFSPFLLSVICAHSTRFVEKHLGEALVARARLLMSAEILRDSSIPTVQGLLQLSAREIGQGAISQAWLYSGMAFRMSTDLGLHLSTESISTLGQPLNAQDKEIRTRLSWACFLWDKAMSLYLGRTPTLLEPPSNDPNFLDDSAENELWSPVFPGDMQPCSLPEYPSTPSCAISNFGNFCKLSIIINDVILHLYGRRRPANLSSFVQRARERLDVWLKDTPAHLRIDVNAPPVFCPPPHILTTSLLYYAATILLHRPLGNVGFAKAAIHEASKSIETLILLLERTFGFTRTTYLMNYCVYTGATVAVEDMNDGVPGAAESVKTFLRALEGARRLTCPVIGSSIEIIKMNIAQKSPQMLQVLVPHTKPVQTAEGAAPHSVMPAFPYQPVQIDYTGHTNAHVVDPAYASTMLNSYPQHFVDVHEEGWLPQMHR